MKFRAPEQKKHSISASPDLTPLIDVVFLLIIFFMLSATFVVQSSIQVELPEAEGATELESKDLTITMTFDPSAPDGEGRIYVDNEEMIRAVHTVKKVFGTWDQEIFGSWIVPSTNGRVSTKEEA